MDFQTEWLLVGDSEWVESILVAKLFQLGNLNSDKSSVVHSQLEIHIDKLEMGSHEDSEWDLHLDHYIQ